MVSTLTSTCHLCVLGTISSSYKHKHVGLRRAAVSVYSTYKCPSCSLTLKLSTASTSWAPPETHGGVDKQAAIGTTALVCHWFVDWWLIANYFDMWPRCSPLMPACTNNGEAWRHGYTVQSWRDFTSSNGSRHWDRKMFSKGKRK